MKITKKQLKQIIKEEIGKVLNEAEPPEETEPSESSIEAAKKIESAVSAKSPAVQQDLAKDAIMQKLPPEVAAKLLASLEAVSEGLGGDSYTEAILRGIIAAYATADVIASAVGAAPAIAGVISAVAGLMGIKYVKDLLKKRVEEKVEESQEQNTIESFT